MGTEMVVVERPRSEMMAMTVDQVEAQVQLIQQVMRRVMKEGEHYGVIPGTSGKPSLLKPGAEKLSLTFRLRPKFTVTERDLPGGHRDFSVVCDLFDSNGQHQGQGVGSCSTMETKYRYRKANAKCPNCGKETIIKGKQEYGGGWLCFKKQGGCGQKFKDGDPQIENQDMGRVEYDNPADYYNTALKMGKKRAQVDATLTATAASDIFTQDLEDMVENGTVTPKAETASPDQVKLAHDLLRSSVFTDEERKAAREFIGTNPAKDHMARFIDRMREKIETREKAVAVPQDARETTHATKDGQTVTTQPAAPQTGTVPGGAEFDKEHPPEKAKRK